MKIVDFVKRTIDVVGKSILCNVQIWLFRLAKHVVCDTGYFDSILKDLDRIPESNGGRFYVTYNTPIAIVADEFLYNSFMNVAKFKYITPDNYKAFCDEVDVLLIVTAWRGLNNEWRFMGSEGSKANIAIFQVINYYREKGKKVIFYSKEDPPHYSHFLPIAKECDVIFTSALEKINDYKKDCKNNQVYLLKFGINPFYHNPIGCRMVKRKNEVIFSGSWVKRYPNRIKEEEMIFEGVIQAGKKLKIIDRNFELNNWSFLFPMKFYKYISPSIEHKYLQKVHKLYNWAININSISDSKTMFANRVYELQANGNLLISNDSLGVKEQFKEVKIAHNRNDVVNVLNEYDDEEIYEHQMAGVRRVMTGETTFDRVGFMLRSSGFKGRQPQRKVAVLTSKITKEIINEFEEQSYAYKELIELSQQISTELEGCDMVTFWDEKSQYGRFYLEDMINAFKYTDCDYVTKNSFVENGILKEATEHNYTNYINNIYATVFWKSSVDCFKIYSLSQNSDVIHVEKGYSIDHFNYTKGRT